MFKKVLTLITLAFSLTANAALIDNGVYTSDTASGLDWLDLTETRGLSYFDVVSNIENGGSFSGWRYATIEELSAVTQQFGLDDIIFSSVTSELSASINLMNSYFGDLFYGLDAGNPSNLSGSYGMVAGPTENIGCCGSQWWQPGALVKKDILSDQINVEVLGLGSYVKADGFNEVGSYLVRDASAVPVPAALWLFSSALIGLIEINRKKLIN